MFKLKKRKRQIVTLIMSLFITTLILNSFAENAFACGCPAVAPSSGRGANISPPIPPLIIPPEFFHTWGAKDVIESFNKNKLEIEAVSQVTEVEKRPLPVKTKEVKRFSVPSSGDGTWGYIFTFEKKNNLNKSQKHYLELNEKGDLYTWSFVKDNILLLVTGTIPEDIAKQYQSALNDLKKE